MYDSMDVEFVIKILHAHSLLLHLKMLNKCWEFPHIEPSNQKDLTNVCQTFRLVSAARWSSTSVERTSVSATMLPPRQGNKTEGHESSNKNKRMYCSNDEFFYIDLLINRFRE